MTVNGSFAILGGVAAVAVIALVAACNGGDGSGASGDTPRELDKVELAYRAFREHFVDRNKLDPGKLSEAAVRGMVAELNEPFTYYFIPERFRRSQQTLRGSFEGIGAQVTLRDGKVTIVSPFPDSPAEAAGLLPGDVILEVDGESVEGYSIDVVIDRISGPKGEPVVLRIQRPGTGEVLDLSIVRGAHQTVTVLYEMVTDRLARVQITEFAANTPDSLKRVLDEAIDSGVAGIVLDLRNNPGGLLREVIDIASEFLDDGLVLSQVDADGKRTEFKARGGGKATEIPLVVLVNEGSASASEVLAGALQDQGRAQIIGAQTFGKGDINVPVPFSDGSGLIITTARWFTPQGRTISRVGIAPDIEVPRTPEDIAEGRDPQLDKALNVLEQAVARSGDAPVASHR